MHIRTLRLAEKEASMLENRRHGLDSLASQRLQNTMYSAPVDSKSSIPRSIPSSVLFGSPPIMPDISPAKFPEVAIKNNGQQPLPYGTEYWRWAQPTYISEADKAEIEQCAAAMYPDLGPDPIICLVCEIMNSYLIRGASGYYVLEFRME
jgi:hypothetical protein